MVNSPPELVMSCNKQPPALAQALELEQAPALEVATPQQRHSLLSLPWLRPRHKLPLRQLQPRRALEQAREVVPVLALPQQHLHQQPHLAVVMTALLQQAPICQFLQRSAQPPWAAQSPASPPPPPLLVPLHHTPHPPPRMWMPEPASPLATVPAAAVTPPTLLPPLSP